MTGAEHAPLTLEGQSLTEVHLSPGDIIRFQTECGAKYTIRPHIVVAGATRSRIERKLGKAKNPPFSAIDVFVTSAGRAGVIIVGEQAEITGLDVSNGRRFEFITRPVQTIERQETKDKQPTLDQMLHKAGVKPNSAFRRKPARKKW